ncbi:hypothetical protein QL285_012701 [Trifolium repens]|nr:hypothetical protein QL285_012701 [Trifolium repens]
MKLSIKALSHHLMTSKHPSTEAGMNLNLEQEVKFGFLYFQKSDLIRYANNPSVFILFDLYLYAFLFFMFCLMLRIQLVFIVMFY